MPAADPRHVVGELERLVPVGVGPFRAVAEAAEPGDADDRNAPRLGRIRRDAGDAQLLHDVALERQLASEGVEEVVEAEAELVETVDESVQVLPTIDLVNVVLSSFVPFSFSAGVTSSSWP